MPPAMPHVEGVEHHYADLDGLRMHYAEAGDPEADVVLLVHGWPENWWAWRALIGPLAERFRVICPDLRGLGWTDAPPRGYEKAQLARDVVALMDVLGIERARWVGHDWGGFAGWYATTEHPERFERFMPLSIPHPWPDDGPPDPRRLVRLWYQAVLAAPVLGRFSVSRLGFPLQILRKSRKAGSWSDVELELYGELMRSDGHANASVQYYRSFLLHEFVPIARGTFRERRLTVPTRLMAGTSDPIVRGMGDAYRDYADDMEVELVPGVAHWLPEERPDVVLERALEFLP
jgi:pimeloyl-ACP methyl ester carboxylesterase